MARWGIAIAYAVLTALAAGLAVVWRWAPFTHPKPWLVLEPVTSHTYSALLGIAFGALIVVLTPMMVAHFHWARQLCEDLRPIAKAMSPLAIAVVGPASGLVEELLFRGLLQSWVGLGPQALIFGLLHYMPGRSRWVWVIWAAVVGLLFGAIFQLTGSLLGPIAAHVMINWINLGYLRRQDRHEPKRRLGGLLGGDIAGSRSVRWLRSRSP